MTIEAKANGGLSLSQALQKAQKSINSGISTKVLIHPGVYREALPPMFFDEDGKDVPLEICGFAEKKCETLISGADQLDRSGWREIGKGLYSKPYSNDFGFKGDPWFPVKDSIGHRCEQLIVDGIPYIPVSVEDWSIEGFWSVETPEEDRGEMSRTYKGFRNPEEILEPGEFAISQGPDLGANLYIRFDRGHNPETSDIEITARQTLLELGSKKNITLANLAFCGAGTFPHGEDMSGVKIAGPVKNLVISDCDFVWNSALGLSLSNIQNLTISRCRFNFNGYGGLGLDEITDFSIRDCEFSGNDWRNYLGGDIWNSHCTAGVKIHKSADGEIRSSRAVRNGINGIWLDIQCKDITVEECLCRENMREGLFFEFSYGPFYARKNRLIKNGEHDYFVDAVGQSIAIENEIIHNGKAEAVCFGQGMRYNEHAGPDQKPGIHHVFTKNTIALDKEDGRFMGLYNRIYPFQNSPEDLAAYERFPSCMNVESNDFSSSGCGLIYYEDKRLETSRSYEKAEQCPLPGSWDNNRTLTQRHFPKIPNDYASEGWDFWKKLKNKDIYEQVQ